MTSKRQKQAGYILPAVIETAETISICVTLPYTPEYRDAFLGAIFSLQSWWNWEKSYSVGDTRAKEAAQLWRDVMQYSILDDCEGGADVATIFRENPLDNCEVQYSIDEGVNWVTMFRKDNCLGVAGASGIEINTSITTITNNAITYAGDIINLAPKWTYAAGITNLALCWSIKKYVDYICDFRLSQLTDNSALLEISYFAQKATDLLIAVGVGLAAATGQVAVAAAGAAAYALAKIGYDIIDAALSNDREHYEDSAAREAIACWMYQKIKGATPQYAPWAASLNDWSYGADDASDAIASVVEIANQDTDLYMNFLLSLEDVNDVTGSLPACDCPQPLIFDQLAGPTLTEMYGTLYTMPSSLVFSNPGDAQALCPGIYNAANDRYQEVTSSIGGNGCNIKVWLPENHLVTQISVKWGISRPSVFGGGDKNAGVWIGDPTGSGVYIAGHSWPGGTYGYTEHTVNQSNVLGLTPTPHDAVYIHNSVQTGSGVVRVTWIHIECIPYVP